MRALIVFFGLLLYPILLLGQENGTVSELLREAQGKVYSQPEQTEKIAEYIIKQAESDTVKAHALLLLSQSQYAQGNLNGAAKNILEAQELTGQNEDVGLNLQISQFAIKLMRELGLHNVAQHYLSTLHSLQKKTDSDSATQIAAIVTQDSAAVRLQADDYRKAESLLLLSRKEFINLKDTLALFENALLLSEVYKNTSRLGKAAVVLQEELDKIASKNGGGFQELQLLCHLGEISFSEKEYETSIQLYERTLKLAELFRNNYYQSKCLEGLSLNYLALEYAKKFYAFKQQAGNFAALAQNDRNQAVNTVFNFISDSGNQKIQSYRDSAYIKIYMLLGFLGLLLLAGLMANHWYRTRAREYNAILKFIQPTPQAKEPEPEPEKLHSEKSSVVPEDIERNLLKKLDAFERGTKFTNQEMSIAYLASLFDTNTKYLSEVINRQKGKNFNSYINELRINYIIEKLKTEPVYFNYKISYLAEESGFSSHSSFATVFKSVTGISPTKFMDLLQKRKESA